MQAAKIKNDEQGRLRFSQSAQQAVNSTLSFTSYDALSQPTVSGEAATTADFDALQADIDQSFESDPLNAISVTVYDTKPSSAEFPWDLFASQTGAIHLENTLQGVAAEAYKTNGNPPHG